MRILFVAIGEKHRASSRFRAYWWADQLAQYGHECRVLPYFRNLPPGLALHPPLDSLYRRQLIWRTVYREILAGAAWADAVVLQEVLLPKWLLTAVRRHCSSNVSTSALGFYCAEYIGTMPALIDNGHRIPSK